MRVTDIPNFERMTDLERLQLAEELSQRAAERYRAQNGVAEVVVIDGDGGHLEGVLNVAKQDEAIRAFLAR